MSETFLIPNSTKSERLINLLLKHKLIAMTLGETIRTVYYHASSQHCHIITSRIHENPDWAIVEISDEQRNIKDSSYIKVLFRTKLVIDIVNNETVTATILTINTEEVEKKIEGKKAINDAFDYIIATIGPDENNEYFIKNPSSEQLLECKLKYIKQELIEIELIIKYFNRVIKNNNASSIDEVIAVSKVLELKVKELKTRQAQLKTLAQKIQSKIDKTKPKTQYQSFLDKVRDFTGL